MCPRPRSVQLTALTSAHNAESACRDKQLSSVPAIFLIGVADRNDGVGFAFGGLGERVGEDDFWKLDAIPCAGFPPPKLATWPR